jgi:hypothetical protein|tara:strand:- start:117 stop:509 length:393 start_codon:yes stop_codon:yes gene_type:complete
MKQVKTAKGRIIDMAALAKLNEQTRAVSPGNTNMNGRGDHLDASGNVAQTVQTKARAVHNTTSAPEKRKLSDAPTSTPKAKAKAKAASDTPELDIDDGLMVVREEEKERADGSRYLETEFDDGSMDTKEL